MYTQICIHEKTCLAPLGKDLASKPHISMIQSSRPLMLIPADLEAFKPDRAHFCRAMGRVVGMPGNSGP